MTSCDCATGTADQRRPRDKYENLLLGLLEKRTRAEEVWSYPIELILDPSSVCPLQCKFCVHSKQPAARAYQLMEWELFERLIAELGPYLFRLRLYNWGEPLLNRRLPDMIVAAKRRDIPTSVSTSLAVSVSDALIDALIGSGLDELIVALDGTTQETYGKYRVGGRLEIVMSNLRRLVEAKQRRGSSKPRIEWQFLVFSFNEHQRAEAASAAEKLGVDFRPVAPYVEFDEYAHWLPSETRFVKERYRKHLSVSSPPHGESPVEGGPVAERMTSLSGRLAGACDFLYSFATVNANGSVSPCCGIDSEEHDFGQLAPGTTFHSVWNNEKFRAARRIAFQGGAAESAGCGTPICARCPFPELTGVSRAVERAALAGAPERVRTLAHRLLQDPVIPQRDPPGESPGVDPRDCRGLGDVFRQSTLFALQAANAYAKRRLYSKRLVGAPLRRIASLMGSVVRRRSS